mmetsp:Transcript_711/g.1394  ORF Transcript_711/g.1394 Transcript_711/m.1394 type:complete len:259 (+) Transcript_711:764-1540(+)
MHHGQAHSLEIARARVADAALENVEIQHGRLEDFDAQATPFDLGIALHACGAASDLTLDLCIAARAAYIMAPCCVGKIRATRKAGVTRRQRFAPCGMAAPKNARSLKEEQPSDAGLVRYPRSERIGAVLNVDEWATVARAADFSERDDMKFTLQMRKRRICKAFVEHDRNLLAQEAGYRTHTSVFRPRTCTPKNDVISGWPGEWCILPHEMDAAAANSPPPAARLADAISSLEPSLFGARMPTAGDETDLHHDDYAGI